MINRTSKYLKTILFLACILSSQVLATGFLHANGKQIVDGDGKNFLIRAMGIGAWMVMEPYMFNLHQDVNKGQHSILNRYREIIGEERTKEFHKAWLDNFFREVDVAQCKESGFNAIRVVLHYNIFTLPIEQEPDTTKNTWLPEGFARLDSLIAWCERYEIYAILDLHAAPGGQGYDGNISDYDPTKKSLWESSQNKRKMVALFGEFAKRYADQPWMGGYDLLNETNWSFDQAGGNGCSDNSNRPLRDLFGQLTTEIRKYDKNHIIFLEGNCWAKNFNGLWPLAVADNNVVLSFHKYWDKNDPASISTFTKLRDDLKVPLWMGESGENTNEWYAAAVRLLEANNIGWSWWTWKKGNDNKGSYTIKYPDGFQAIIDYTNGKAKPDASKSYTALMNLAEATKLEKCTRNNASIDSIILGHKTAIQFKAPTSNFAADIQVIKNGARINIQYTLQNTANVNLSVFGVNGKTILSKALESQSGKNSFTFDLSGRSYGVFVVKANCDQFTYTRNIVIGGHGGIK